MPINSATCTMPVLDVTDLRVTFGGLTAVDGVSICIDSCEIRGLIGPNGAGKTTLFNAVSGLVPIASGSITLDGEALTGRPAHARAAAGLRRTFQAVQLVPHATVLENVLIGDHVQIRQSLFQALIDWRVRRGPEHLAQRRAYETLDTLQLADLALEPVGSLSFAQQRRVEIARALVGAPRLLMLDEPAAGLSPDDIGDLGQLLGRLRRDRGLTILIIEHVLHFIFELCDRITVLDSGKVIAEAPPQLIANDPAVRRAYIGEQDAPVA